jgi:ubiquinone/menaquinone biosynthesis C-methylase UbiE
MAKKIKLQDQLEIMERDWDARARQNAHYYVASSRNDWTDEDFFASGDAEVSGDILNDMANVCSGKDPKTMRVIEIGCGAGRVTRALSNIFGEVHAVDVSGEMVAQARAALKDRPNAHVYHNNGCDLSVVPALEFDFAYSIIVFQHIPSRDVIENYVREVHRLLRPGSLFKFQLQGYTALETNPTDTSLGVRGWARRMRVHIGLETKPIDTWLGVPFSPEQIQAMADRCGFELRHSHGAGTQYYYLWFYKK